MADVRIAPGAVTQESPLRVKIDGEDEEGLPCQKLATARLGDVGGVLKVGTQRLWIGAYDRADEVRDLDGQVRQVVESQQDQQRALNETSAWAEQQNAAITDRVDGIAGDVSEAALVAASASGIIILSDTSPLPTVRPGGAPLAAGDLLYLTTLPAESGGPTRITGVRIYDGNNWLEYVMVAEHLMAVNSIVGDLIAAGAEIVAPLINGGIMIGAILQTAADDDDAARVRITSTSSSPSAGTDGGIVLFEDQYRRRLMELFAGYDADTGRPAYALRIYAQPVGGQGALTSQLDADGMTFYDETTGHPVSRIGPGGLQLADGQYVKGIPDILTYGGGLRVSAAGPILLNENYGSATDDDLTIARRLRVLDKLELPGDTDGWVNLSLNSGLTGSLAYEIKAGRVEVRGEVTRTAGAFPTSYTAICTLPAVARPSSTFRVAFTGDNPALGVLEANISTSGTISVRAVATGPGRAWVTIPPFSTT